MKNKNTVIAVGVVFVVIFGLLGFYFVSNSSKEVPEEIQSSEVVVQTIKPEDIGFAMEATPDKKKVKFSIAKAKGITALEYEITYEADATKEEMTEGGEDRVARGITGEATVVAGKSTFESEDLDLGSCSRNVCKYDKGVESVDITLKITKADGKVYNMEDSLIMQ